MGGGLLSFFRIEGNADHTSTKWNAEEEVGTIMRAYKRKTGIETGREEDRVRMDKISVEHGYARKEGTVDGRNVEGLREEKEGLNRLAATLKREHKKQKKNRSCGRRMRKTGRIE